MQRSDVSRLSQWADPGVSEVVYGMPDESTEEVQAYLDRLSDKLDIFGPHGAAAAAR
jgi:hypothetical protein